MKLNQKTIVVTGGAMGIGEACAKLLKENGANVIIVDFNKEAGEKTAEQLGCGFFQADISNEEDIAALRDFIKEKYGCLDVLINNAAKQTEKNFFDFTVKDFSSDIRVNLVGTFTCIHTLCQIMKPGSTILNMLSVHYEQPRLNKFAYDASKAGEAMLTKETALVLAEKGITVNAISYGAVRTPMNRDWIEHPEHIEQAKEKIPLGWVGEPEEIASFVKAILTEFSEHATGSIFTIDGGRRLK